MQYQAGRVEQRRDGADAGKAKRHGQPGTDEQGTRRHEQQAGDVERDVDVLLFAPRPECLPIRQDLGLIGCGNRRICGRGGGWTPGRTVRWQPLLAGRRRGSGVDSRRLGASSRKVRRNLPFDGRLLLA